MKGSIRFVTSVMSCKNNVFPPRKSNDSFSCLISDTLKLYFFYAPSTPMSLVSLTDETAGTHRHIFMTSHEVKSGLIPLPRPSSIRCSADYVPHFFIAYFFVFSRASFAKASVSVLHFSAIAFSNGSSGFGLIKRFLIAPKIAVIFPLGFHLSCFNSSTQIDPFSS